MGREKLVEKAAELCGLPPEEVRIALEAILRVKEEAFVSGEDVVFEGFGAYRQRINPARRAQDFTTGEEIRLSESRTVRFKPSRYLGDRLNRRGATMVQRAG